MYILRENTYSLDDKDNTKRQANRRKKKYHLSDIQSNRGLGRAMLTSPLTGGGSMVGGYITKDMADEDYDNGVSQSDIVRRARHRGAKAGALTGFATGGLAGAVSNAMLAPKGNKKLAFAKGLLGGSLTGTLLGSVGGRNAAGVNVKSRLNKLNKKNGDREEYTKKEARLRKDI